MVDDSYVWFWLSIVSVSAEILPYHHDLWGLVSWPSCTFDQEVLFTNLRRFGKYRQYIGADCTRSVSLGSSFFRRLWPLMQILIFLWWKYHILHSNQCTFHVWPTWSGNELSKWQTSVIQSVTNIHLEISNAWRRPSERNVEFPTVSKLYSCKSTDDDDGEYASIMKTITILMLRTMMVTMFMMMMKKTEKIIMKWDRLPQQVLRHGNSQVVSITTLLHSLYHCISFEMMMQMLMRTMVMTIDSFQARCWKWRQKTGKSNYALDKPV